MMAAMKVALAQINTTVGDLRGNAEKILHFYDDAVRRGAELVIFPELALTGYPPRDLVIKTRFVNDNLATLDKIAGLMTGATAIVGYVHPTERAAGKALHNAAAVIARGKIVARVFKSLLPTYDVFDEDRYFQPADSVAPVTACGTRLGVTICEDIWNVVLYGAQRLYQRDPIQELVGAGAQFIVNLSSSPYHLGKESFRHQMLRDVALKHGKPLFYANSVGGNDELIFDGNSFAFNARGELIARGKAFEEDLVVFDSEARAIPYSAPREEAALMDALVLGLRDYAGKCGFRSAVLGLSGGIDSAVVASVAVRALGAENVWGVGMPSQFSSEGSVTDARALAQNLGIRFEVIPIQEPFDAVKRAMKKMFAGKQEDTTEENMQARIRGIYLMAVSNKFGHLLLTTGNKSELAVGYCTLYGDMAGGLAVISDVPKTVVYQLAHYINSAWNDGKRRMESGERKRDGFPIPLASITKPPSAELRPNQTDQDSLPPYEVLDPIMRAYVEDAKSGDEIVAIGHDEATVRRVIRMIDLNEYKRKQAPPGLRVTAKAFGIGRRMPIAQRFVG